MNQYEIKAPRLNTNDDELLIQKIFVKEKQKIKSGEKIFLVETSKTSIEIETEYDGYVHSIDVSENEYVKVGEKILTVISENIKQELKDDKEQKENQLKKDSKRRISLKAQKFINENNLDINNFNHIKGDLKLNDVLSYFEKNEKFDKNKPSIILGTGLHAKEIADQLEKNKIPILGFCSKNNENKNDFILGKNKVICVDEEIESLKNYKNLNYYIGVGGPISNNLRKEIFEKLNKKKLNLPSLISKNSSVSDYARIGKGTVILPGAVIGPNVVIGENCIINCNSIVSHGCNIGNHVHLTPGATLAGNCNIGDLTTIGMNSTVFGSVRVGKNCLTHNNSTILIDLKDGYEINTQGKI